MSPSTIRRKRLDALRSAINRCRLDLTFKKVKTAREVLHYLDVPTTRFPDLALDESLTVSAYNVHIAKPLEESLIETLKQEAEKEKQPTPNTPHEKPATDSVAIITSVPSNTDELSSSKEGSKIELLAKYPVSLYYHQVTAVKDLKQKLLIENKRAALLQAGVGTGKTFIYGAFLAELWQTGWFEGKSFSPWPALVITKASIVQQTARVLANHFKLCPVRQFKVMNYDALRSAKGMESVIDKQKVVINGERVIQYKWRPFLHPTVVIIDESQSAKNEDSTQSKIIQNLADVEDPNLKLVFSSATPWTRVAESKYFCINLKMDYKL